MRKKRWLHFHNLEIQLTQHTPVNVGLIEALVAGDDEFFLEILPIILFLI